MSSYSTNYNIYNFNKGDTESSKFAQEILNGARSGPKEHSGGGSMQFYGGAVGIVNSGSSSCGATCASVSTHCQITGGGYLHP